MKIRATKNKSWECLYGKYKLLMKKTPKGCRWEVYYKNDKIGKGRDVHTIEATDAARYFADSHKKSLNNKRAKKNNKIKSPKRHK